MTNRTVDYLKMWNETDLDTEREQFVPEHTVTVNPSNRIKAENGDYHHHHHSQDSLVDTLPHHNHLLRHELLTDAMLGHVVDARPDQVRI